MDSHRLRLASGVAVCVAAALLAGGCATTPSAGPSAGPVPSPSVAPPSRDAVPPPVPSPATRRPETAAPSPCPPAEGLDECRAQREELQKELSRVESTVRELQAQLADLRDAAGEVIENVKRYSTRQVAAMHAEAKVMVQRMEASKSPQAAELAGYAREHFREGESQLAKGNPAGAAFYFAQISGIYSRFQKLALK